MESQLIIAIVSVILGHIITRFLDRAKPLLIIEGFSTATKNTTKVMCSNEVSRLSKQSWSTGVVLPGEIAWGKLSIMYEISVFKIESLIGAESHAEKIIGLLKSAQEPSDINSAMKEIFEHVGMQSILEMALLRDVINITSKSYDGEGAISGILHQTQRNGCYIIVFDDAIGNIGERLNIDQWRKEKLKPLFDAIRYHDKDTIIYFLKEITSYIKDQRDIHTNLKELLTPMRENESIWIAHCSLANYGTSPLILRPEAELSIIRENGKREQPIPCYVSVEEKKEDNLDANDLRGPKIIVANEEMKIWVITKNKKGTMENGNLIEGCFKDQKSKAQVFLNIEQPNLNFFRKAKSSYSPFVEYDK